MRGTKDGVAKKMDANYKEERRKKAEMRRRKNKQKKTMLNNY